MGLIQYNTEFYKTDHDAVLDLHAQKNTNREICEKLNITSYMVEKILNYYNLKPVKNIDKIDHQLVIDLYNKTNKISEVSNMLDIEDYMVDKILILNNVTKRSVKLKLDHNQVINDYLNSRDIKEVAKKYGVSITPIDKILKQNNIKRKKNPNSVFKKVGKKRVKVDIDVNQVINLYKELGTILDVSKKLSIHSGKIRKILLENNVDMTFVKRIEIGDKFDMLTIIGYSENKRTSGGESKKMLLCKCECGTEVIRSSSALRNKKDGKLTFKSCGCHIEDKKKRNEEIRLQKKLVYEKKLEEYRIQREIRDKKRLENIEKYGSNKRYNIGDKKDRFTIIDIQGTHPDKSFTVICECGTQKILKYQTFKQSKSCGCLQVERSTIHGHSSKKDPHRRKWYDRWKGMLSRCYNPKMHAYHNYGGRGIRVCDRWREPNGVGFENYYDDIHNILGPQPSSNHSLDRIDNDGMYEITNLRWATLSVQAKNQRRFVK